MGIQRRSRFGFPPPVPPSSQHTVRAIPMSGIAAGPWPMHPPGSAHSMTNFLPVDGKLVPRSRLSSMNTIRSMLTIQGITPKRDADGTATFLWISDRTRHGLLNTSTGSISVASFVSAAGLGVASIAQSAFMWQYAHVYMDIADDNVLVCAPGVFSYGTLEVAYQLAAAPLRYSYLTSAPRARCVGAFDNYVVAWNVEDSASGADYASRVQWCQRGNPNNWTGEGSGFEDLLEMRGEGNRVIGSQDNRLILFSTQEIWYGLPATYPAQFQFYPLERSVGLLAPMTVAETDLGVLFLGTDLNIRLLPVGGGQSRIFAPQMREAIQRVVRGSNSIADNLSWGMFDPVQRLYYLHIDIGLAAAYMSFVLNVDTGEWGRMQYPEITPQVGCSFMAPSGLNLGQGHMYVGDSKGTVYSLNTRLGPELGFPVTSTWQSAPLATDLHNCHKTITNIFLDYRSSSTATIRVGVVPPSGTLVGAVSTVTLSPGDAGTAEAQTYGGHARPSIYMTSDNTGYELHRMDVQMVIGGRA
jgi:hypothetical protein